MVRACNTRIYLNSIFPSSFLVHYRNVILSKIGAKNVSLFIVTHQQIEENNWCCVVKKYDSTKDVLISNAWIQNELQSHRIRKCPSSVRIKAKNIHLFIYTKSKWLLIYIHFVIHIADYALCSYLWHAYIHGIFWRKRFLFFVPLSETKNRRFWLNEKKHESVNVFISSCFAGFCSFYSQSYLVRLKTFILLILHATQHVKWMYKLQRIYFLRCLCSAIKYTTTISPFFLHRSFKICCVD